MQENVSNIFVGKVSIVLFMPIGKVTLTSIQMDLWHGSIIWHSYVYVF